MSCGLHGQVLGTDDLFAYVEKYRMTLDPHYEDLLGRHQRKPWVKFINPDVQHLCSEEGLNFLSKLLVRQLDMFGLIIMFVPLPWAWRCRVMSCFRCNNRRLRSGAIPDSCLQVYDHQLRATAKEAMEDPYFAPVLEVSPLLLFPRVQLPCVRCRVRLSCRADGRGRNFASNTRRRVRGFRRRSAKSRRPTRWRSATRKQALARSADEERERCDGDTQSTGARRGMEEERGGRV